MAADESPTSFKDLYFSYASNLSPLTMKGRHPGSLFCGLAKLDGWKFNINSTGFANIVQSEAHHVYGALYFISAADEAAIDEMESVPDHYQKQHLEVEKINKDGAERGQMVPALVYIDSTRPDEGQIGKAYVVWIRKAIRDARSFGLPDEYIEKYVRPCLPASEEGEVEQDMEPVRMILTVQGPR